MAEAPNPLVIPKRLPLIAQPGNRSNQFYKDARLVNAYAEKNPEGQWEIEKRVGLGQTPAWTFAQAGGAGMFLWSLSTALSILMIVVDTSLYEVAISGGPIHVPSLAKVGTIAVGGTRVRFQPMPISTSGILGVLYVQTPTAGYTFSQSGLLTQITDTNYPSSVVPGIAYLDATTYVMDVFGNIWGSATANEVTTWDGLNVIPTNAESDFPIALGKQLVYVIAFKSTTTQIFYDNANATGSPLSPLPNALINYGCMHSETIQDINGILLWVTADQNVSPQVGMLQNLAFSIISTPAIERLLAGSTYSSQFISISFKWAGHSFYVVTSITNNITLVYDLGQQLWYQWTDSNGNYYPIVAQAVDLSGKQIFQAFTTGTVYFMDGDYVYPNDYGNVFPVDIYCPVFDGGTKRSKTLNMMYFGADQTRGSKLQARYSDDDYQSWSNFRSIDLSHEKPLLDQEGSFIKRAYHFRHQANTALRIRSVDIQLDIGSL